MRTSWHRFFPFLAFSGLLLSLATTAPASPQSDAEIVRLAYVQGDVRVSRGNGSRPDLYQSWEQAEYNTPIQQGCSLARNRICRWLDGLSCREFCPIVSEASSEA